MGLRGMASKLPGSLFAHLLHPSVPRPQQDLTEKLPVGLRLGNTLSDLSWEGNALEVLED